MKGNKLLVIVHQEGASHSDSKINNQFAKLKKEFPLEDILEVTVLPAIKGKPVPKFVYDPLLHKEDTIKYANNFGKIPGRFLKQQQLDPNTIVMVGAYVNVCHFATYKAFTKKFFKSDSKTLIIDIPRHLNFFHYDPVHYKGIRVREGEDRDESNYVKPHKPLPERDNISLKELLTSEEELRNKFIIEYYLGEYLHPFLFDKNLKINILYEDTHLVSSKGGEFKNPFSKFYFKNKKCLFIRLTDFYETNVNALTEDVPSDIR